MERKKEKKKKKKKKKKRRSRKTTHNTLCLCGISKHILEKIRRETHCLRTNSRLLVLRSRPSGISSITDTRLAMRSPVR